MNTSPVFQNLLAAWRRREDARLDGSHRELASTRLSLEAARSEILAARFGR